MSIKRRTGSLNEKRYSWQDRAGRPKEVKVAEQRLEPGQHYFLGIAIDQYQSWPKLRNAKRDVFAITDLLVKDYGFREDNVIVLADEAATLDGIIATLDGLVKLVTRKDSLVIYYAGHGHYDTTTERGFWIPVDAEVKKTQDFIRNSTIKDYIADIPSLHTLLISDSCFSGSLFVRGFQREASLTAQELMRLPSRWAICSGRHDETVADGPVNGHSPFAQSIIDVLETTEREYISSDFLLMQVREQTRANYDQLPDGGPLQHVDHKRGQYVFRRIDSITADTEQWERINLMPEDSLSEAEKKLKEIRRYCITYPRSIHVEAAKNEEKLLEGLVKYWSLPNTKAALSEYLIDFPNSPYKHEIKTRLTKMENREIDQKKWKQRLLGAAAVAGLAALIVYGRYTPGPNPVPKLEPTFQDSLAGVFRLVQGGQFDMGCSTGQRGCQEDERPVHLVTLDSYYIGEFEITQAQWKAVMNTNPSSFAGCDDCPVERVSWNEVQEFILRLNKLTGKKYRLPTEAEWEFAARAGEADYHFLYSGGPDVNDFVWYKDNSSGKTRTVGMKRPNKLGLFDMNGNVWEWCQDMKGPYFEGNQKNPGGPATGYRRVFRGGAWNSSPEYCRISVRGQARPAYRYNFVGFRLAMSI